MREFSTSEFSKKSGEIITAAIREPVMITQRGTPRLVVMSIEDYKALKSRNDTRRVVRLDEVDDELREDMITAIEEHFGRR